MTITKAVFEDVASVLDTPLDCVVAQRGNGQLPTDTSRLHEWHDLVSDSCRAGKVVAARLNSADSLRARGKKLQPATIRPITHVGPGIHSGERETSHQLISLPQCQRHIHEHSLSYQDRQCPPLIRSNDHLGLHTLCHRNQRQTPSSVWGAITRLALFRVVGCRRSMLLLLYALLR